MSLLINSHVFMTSVLLMATGRGSDDERSFGVKLYVHTYQDEPSDVMKPEQGQSSLIIGVTAARLMERHL